MPSINIISATDTIRVKLFRPGTVGIGSHIMAVFPDEETEVRGALEFLRHGVRNNELVMIITDILSKEMILDRMNSNWKVDASKLEVEGDIIIKSSREWYFPNGVLDPKHIGEKWNAVVSLSTLTGKNGLRVCGSATSVLHAGLASEWVEYESALSSRFDIPLTAMCSYAVKEINSLSLEDVDRLQEHHYQLWAV